MKKIIVICLIFSMLILCISCGANSSSENNTGTTDNPAAEEKSESTETEEEKIMPDLPEMNFGGLEIILFGRALETTGYVKNYSETASEEENGEIMNDAIYKRNRVIEEKYNVIITGKLSGDYGSLSGEIKKSVTAGDNFFDAAFASINDCVGLSTEGFLVDLKTVPNINLEKPWWDQRAESDLSIGGKLFFTLGDITPWAHSFTSVIVFNKDIIQEFGLESPYNIVRDNQWTLDKFYEYCLAVSGDTDGNGIINEFDRHGLICASENFIMQVIAGGESLIKKDSEDLPYIAIGGEQTTSVVEKIYDIMTDQQVTMLMEDYSKGYSDPWTDLLRKQFRNGNGLFYIGGLEQMLIFRDLEASIGVLPIPKFNSAQSGYYHTINTYWASTISVPITNIDKLEETGFILEALAAESMGVVKPAYYDITLAGKVMRDDDSIEMLDIILQSRSFDLGMIYGWGGLSGIFSDMINKKSSDFTSRYEKIQSKIEVEMNKTVEIFLEK